MARRDPNSDWKRALEAIGYAKRVEDAQPYFVPSTKDERDAWSVAADAILEAGASDIRQRYEAYEAAREKFDPQRFKRGGGYTAKDWSAIARMAGTLRPSTEEMGRLGLYEFVADPPERAFVYYDEPLNYVMEWTGIAIGSVIGRSRERRLPTGGRVISVRVRAINGYMYRGTCNLSSGTYCRLKRGTRWR